jgi:hypothetical protein
MKTKEHAMKNHMKNFPGLRARVLLVPRRFGWVLALTLGLLAVVAQAQEYGYRYVPFDQVELPQGFTFFAPVEIHDSGRVYGTVCDDGCSNPHIAFYADGVVTALQASGFAMVVNAGGTVGGYVLVDPENFIFQAALFRGDEVELIPPQPDELFSFVIALNDPGTALVESDDEFGNPTYILYENGQATVLDFGPTVPHPRFRSFVSGGGFINNQGLIAGLTAGPTGSIFDGARGFRFDPRTGEAELLDPVAPDTLAWGMGINARGHVLGYSFVLGAPYHERVGVWDAQGKFKTYVDQTISSNALVFNDNNLVVISLADNTSYLVPKPGVRWHLADLVDNLPSGLALSYIFDINNHGDMVGFDDQGGRFLLQRTGATGSASSRAADTAHMFSPGVKSGQHANPAAAAIPYRYTLHPYELK